MTTSQNKTSVRQRRSSIVSFMLSILLLLATVPTAGQLGTVAPPPVFEALNATGTVCASCRLFWYTCGTTTNQTVFSDSALTTAHSQPITLNAAGRPTGDAAIYLTPGVCHKAVLKTSADVEIWSKDNLGPGHGVGNDRLRLSPHSVTIATGAFTATYSQYEVDTEAAAATDDLDTITAGTGVGEGFLLVLTPANVSRVVTVKNSTGNIELGGGDYALNSAGSSLTLYYDGSNWVEMARAVAGAVVQTTTATGTQNDFALTSNASVLRANNATAVTFTGFTPGYDGQRLQIVSVGGAQVNLDPQDAGSTAAYRLINIVTVGNTPLEAGSGVAEYVYDTTTARWRLTSHDQGNWITETFAAGNYAGSAGWTVAAGDETTRKFKLSGSTLTIALLAATTTVTGGATQLTMTIPGGFTSVGTTRGPVSALDNNVSITGMWSTASATTITFFTAPLGTGNWTAATDATFIEGVFTFEVQ